MVKVVQFLEIGNLPKSQLNPCRSRKVMIKNLNFQISKSGSAHNFHNIFEFSLQISRSQDPPVFGLSLRSHPVIRARTLLFSPTNLLFFRIG